MIVFIKFGISLTFVNNNPLLTIIKIKIKISKMIVF